MDWIEFLDDLGADGHTITVELYEGSGAYGDVFGAPLQVERCMVEDKRTRVRVRTQDAAGQEVVSSTTVRGSLTIVAPVGSRVTVPSGRTARVLAVARHDGGGLDVPEHVELALE